MAGRSDCERVQTRWFETRARVLGGDAWTDAGMRWTDGPDGMNLLFPQRIDPGSVRRATDRARELGRDIVGAWLDPDVDPGPLADAGFERGWSPWWMTADLTTSGPEQDPRVRLETDTTDYGGEHAAYRDQLALARVEPTTAWYAAAHVDGRFAGRAWSFLDGALAGVFDMAVWTPFRRRGLGSALLAAVCRAAAAAGAREAVLNATPDGEKLYGARGFTLVGDGITWWLHLPPPS